MPSLSDINKIEWGRSYTWNIRLLQPTPPAPFNSWFPATEVDINLATITSMTFDISSTQVLIPVGSGNRMLTISFIDDSNGTLLTYFKEWMLYISDGFSTRNITEDQVLRLFQITKLDTRGNIVDTYNVSVFPIGEISFRGNSQSELSRFDLRFAICSPAVDYS